MYARLPGKDAADKLDLLSQASDAVSEMELLGAQVNYFAGVSLIVTFT